MHPQQVTALAVALAQQLRRADAAAARGIPRLLKHAQRHEGLSAGGFALCIRHVGGNGAWLDAVRLATLASQAKLLRPAPLETRGGSLYSGDVWQALEAVAPSDEARRCTAAVLRRIVEQRP